MLKVFLGGEGSNELGTRWYVPMGDELGVVEALLRRIRPGGWRVAAALPWKRFASTGRAPRTSVRITPTRTT